jgi:hypothetical protein
MNKYRKTAIIVGILYIIGTVAGILSVVVTGPILEAGDLLAAVAANPNQLKVGVLLVLTMGLSLAMVPAMLFPLFRKINEALAVGYVIFRGALEAFYYMLMVSFWLLLVVVAQASATAATGDSATLRILGTLLLDGHLAINPLMFAFSLALMLYSVLYRSQLVPRWISIWGFIAIVMHLIRGFLIMFQLMQAFDPLNMAMNFPIFLQEMVMAVWLIAKGFSPAALASLSAKTAKNGHLSAS